MEKQEVNLHLPEVSSAHYKESVKQILQLVKELNDFTNNLEGKVSTMLKGQETEFVNSYRQHMFKIENVLKQYQLKMEDYQKKIQHYENEGMLAILLKKIHFLQDNQRKWLQKLEKKDKDISKLKGQIQTLKRQIEAKENKIKELIINAPNQTSDNKHSEHTFATEVNVNLHTLKSSRSIDELNSGRKYETIGNPESQQLQSESKRMNRQLLLLKKRNRQLSSVNSKIIEKASSIEQFFLKTVNELKKKIRGRKRISQCSFEDFKEEDKLELLVKVLSNEELLQHLYNKIFNRQKIVYQTASREKCSLNFDKVGTLAVSQQVIERLPAISARQRR